MPGPGEVTLLSSGLVLSTSVQGRKQTARCASVFNLGPALIEYGCPIYALTQYALVYFECSAFLERLAGGYGNGPYVNCTDCATIVSTFANALGCDLWQSRMGPFLGPFFFTNPIRVIGSPSPDGNFQAGNRSDSSRSCYPPAQPCINPQDLRQPGRDQRRREPVDLAGATYYITSSG